MSHGSSRDASTHARAVASWVQESALPRSGDDGSLVLVLESLRALSGVRRQVRAFLAAGCTTGFGDACEDAVDRAVQVIDELTSNALRHGLQPSSVQIRDEPGRWLVVVRDAAPDRLPAPAVDRPAGEGGYGLYMVADLTTDHGVHYEADHKLVWALLTKPANAG